MQRKQFVLMLCMIMVFSILAACGGNNNDPKPTDQPAATNSGGGSTDNGSNSGGGSDDIKDRPVKISIYYPLPDQVEQRAAEDAKIERFLKEYPNVEIVKSDWHYNPAEIGMKMAANEAPTFFNTWATEAKFLVERGWVADISDLWNSYEHKDAINPVLQSQFEIDGKVFGIVQNGYVTTTVVNKKMLDEKGVSIPGYDWTWDDLYNAAVGVADPGAGIAGIAPMGRGNEAGWNWTNFLFEAGGQIQDVADGKVTATFNSDAGLKALQFYHKLRWEGDVIPQDWALGWGDAVGAFAQQRTAMVIAGAGDVLEQALNQGGLTPDDVLVYPMPAAQQGGKHSGVLGGNWLVINPNTSKDEQEIAFRYITFDYFDENGIEALENDIKARQADGKYYIPAQLNYYSSDSDYGKKMQEMFEKYDNVYQYAPESDRLLDGNPEAQFNTQDYYAEMTNVIQEVFSSRDADLQALLDNAAKLVQENFYNDIVVE